MVKVSTTVNGISDTEMRNGDFFNIRNDSGGTRLGYDKGKFVYTGMPAWFRALLGMRFDHDPTELRAMFADIPTPSLKYWSYAMLVPLFAALLYAVYRSRRLVYGEHLVFALHLHTFWLLAVLVLSVMSDAVSEWLRRSEYRCCSPSRPTRCSRCAACTAGDGSLFCCGLLF